MSIDNATPEEWNKLRNSKASIAEAWNRIYDEDNEPNDHPLYGDYKYDNVHRPEHYNTGSIECIDAIRGMLNHDEYIGYLRGNALKYMWRFRYKKSPIEDLRKARWYEERLISYMLEHPSDK